MFASEFLFTHLSGFNVIDCEVRDRSRLYLLARLDYTQNRTVHRLKGIPSEGRLQKRLFILRLENPEDTKWGVMRLDGLNTSQCAMAFAPEPKIVAVDSDSKAWAQNPDTNGFEPPIKSEFEGGIKLGAITRVRCFGDYVFAINNGRQVFCRKEVGNWELVGGAIPYEYRLETASDSGFEDLDRFGPADMYAVGGAGDIWHFNGSTWRQCAFPTDWGLSAVCCAADGQAYVAAGPVIYRGLGDRWKRLRTKAGPMSIPIKDLVWYEDKLWATSDYGVWILEGDTLVEADLPSEVRVCAGNLAVRDGVMLLAGYGGAAFKRDGQWTVIFHDYELRQRAAKGQ
jgi:hypothetical protein